MARVFAVMVQKFVEHYVYRGTKQVESRVFVTLQDSNFGHESSVAVQFVSEAEIYHGVDFRLRADAGIQVHLHYKFVLGAGAVCKNRDNLSRKAGNKLPILSVL
jgi:hypothetical protein